MRALEAVCQFIWLAANFSDILFFRKIDKFIPVNHLIQATLYLSGVVIIHCFTKSLDY